MKNKNKHEHVFYCGRRLGCIVWNENTQQARFEASPREMRALENRAWACPAQARNDVLNFASSACLE